MALHICYCQNFIKLICCYKYLIYLLVFHKLKTATISNTMFMSTRQTWNLSQAPQACLFKILLARVKSSGKHTLFLTQFSLVCVQILGVELTMVSLHYKKRVSTTLHAALGLLKQEKNIEGEYTHKN